MAADQKCVSSGGITRSVGLNRLASLLRRSSRAKNSTIFSKSLTGFAAIAEQTNAPPLKNDEAILVGLGTEWPANLYGPEALEDYVRRWYDPEHPELKKLLAVNRKTGIEQRALVPSFDQALWNQEASPKIEQLDVVYRDVAVKLTMGACRKAIAEWGGSPGDITHTVAVTATNAGNPGFDQLVARELGLSANVNRILLHGVGCAGGLSIMRVASDMADAASFKGRPARILAFACEVCSIHIRSELDATKNNESVGIGPALFSDGAAAFVLCNAQEMGPSTKGVYSLVDRRAQLKPDSFPHMAYRITALGCKLHLTKEVPLLAATSMIPIFEELAQAAAERDHGGTKVPGPEDFDWALHPGGPYYPQGGRRRCRAFA